VTVIPDAVYAHRSAGLPAFRIDPPQPRSPASSRRQVVSRSGPKEQMPRPVITTPVGSKFAIEFTPSAAVADGPSAPRTARQPPPLAHRTSAFRHNARQRGLTGVLAVISILCRVAEVRLWLTMDVSSQANSQQDGREHQTRLKESFMRHAPRSEIA
jgi:hypothetical protein